MSMMWLRPLSYCDLGFRGFNARLDLICERQNPRVKITPPNLQTPRLEKFESFLLRRGNSPNKKKEMTGVDPHIPSLASRIGRSSALGSAIRQGQGGRRSRGGRSGRRGADTKRSCQRRRRPPPGATSCAPAALRGSACRICVRCVLLRSLPSLHRLLTSIDMNEVRTIYLLYF